MSKTVKTGVDASQQSGFVKGGPTGSFKLPTGTTAERDANTTAGQLRFNSQTSFLEFFNGSAFVQLQHAWSNHLNALQDLCFRHEYAH